MKILALDSSTRTAGVAVTDGNRTLSDFASDSGLTQSELLLPMALSALAAAHTDLGEIELFAATVGPGSFTGVRIGVSVIKGLCFGSGRPCVGVSALEALAEGLAPLDGILCPAIDARRAQVYTALFRMQNGNLIRLSPDDHIPIDDLLTRLREEHPGERVWFTGDAAGILHAKCAESFPEIDAQNLPEALTRPSGAAVARCALRAYERGEAVEEEALVPIYLRPAQAERDRLAKEREQQNEKENS